MAIGWPDADGDTEFHADFEIGDANIEIEEEIGGGIVEISIGVEGDIIFATDGLAAGTGDRVGIITTGAGGLWAGGVGIALEMAGGGSEWGGGDGEGDDFVGGRFADGGVFARDVWIVSSRIDVDSNIDAGIFATVDGAVFVGDIGFCGSGVVVGDFDLGVGCLA